MEMLDVRLSLSGKLLIEEPVLLLEKFNLSLGLSMLLFLVLTKLRITSVTSTENLPCQVQVPKLPLASTLTDQVAHEERLPKGDSSNI